MTLRNNARIAVAATLRSNYSHSQSVVEITPCIQPRLDSAQGLIHSLRTPRSLTVGVIWFLAFQELDGFLLGNAGTTYTE